MKTLLELRDRVIADGIAEVMDVYPEGDPKQVGAVEGFELCRSLVTREAFERVLAARTSREQKMRRRDPRGEKAADYWKHRYGTLQVEWVLNCLLAGGWARRGDSLSGRAMRKVAEVTGQVTER